MGIKGLTKLLADSAPHCYRTNKFEDYFNRKIAIDASMHIYQFLVVVGRTGDQMLASETGEVTSHLQGMFYRTVKLLEAGIKPVYVFDGKPPEMKRNELNRRSDARGKNEEALVAAKESGIAEDIEKYSKRTVKVTKQHNEECQRLLKLMGVPVIIAPSEAEAQCAEMCKAGLVYSMASEDMDSLTFGTAKLTRNLMAAASAKLDINEYDYAKVLEGLGLTPDEFIDMCILCGCDYAPTITGVGEKTALKLIKEHHSIEKVLENINTGRKVPLNIPEPFPFDEARRLFKEPEVLKKEEVSPLLKWTGLDQPGILQFLVEEKNFNEDRIRKAMDRVIANKDKANQGRLESFFGAVTTKSSTQVKRKEPGAKSKQPAKKGKASAISQGMKKKK